VRRVCSRLFRPFGPVLESLAGQDRALDNARSACAEVCRQAVEREDVRLFLEGLPARGGRVHSA